MASDSASLCLNVAPGESADAPSLVHVCVAPPPASERYSGDVCVVIDVSGSMQQEATVKTQREEGAPILSVLDIVKHAVKTVVHTMGADDRLGIVSYSDEATTVLGLTSMDEEGQALADQALAGLRANGQTNLWDGLKTGMEMLRANSRDGCTAAVMLLTDGVPNKVPEGGHMRALARYQEANAGALPATVHTFGFGQELDSKLLSNIANFGEGMYVFIPDAGFVGTALVNCTANTLVAMARNAQLELEPVEGCTIESIFGYGNSTGRVPLGSLQFGQTKDVVAQVRVPAGHAGPVVAARLTYEGVTGPRSVEEGSITPIERNSEEYEELLSQLYRSRLAELIPTALQTAKQGTQLEAASALAREFRDEIADNTHERVVGLRADVEGQVGEALSRPEWYNTWGAHYLLSLARAHHLQQCNNFKDPGVQFYGGPLFEDVRDKADEMFLALPAPSTEDNSGLDLLIAMGFDEETAKKALAAANNDTEMAATFCMEGIPERPVYHRGHVPARPPPSGNSYSMAAYYNSAGPCFTGASLVKMAAGDEKPLSGLRKGDAVAVKRGPGEEIGHASVVCVVETLTVGEADLVELSPGLHATPWHPVQMADKWVFPAHVGDQRRRSCDRVFNLVLDQGHVPCVGGLWTVSLGHGIEENTARHHYWGTDKVLMDLKRMQGWQEGRVKLGPGCVLRDHCGRVCGMQQGA